MKRRLVILTCGVATMVMPTSSFAESVDVPLRDVTTVQDGRGAVRVFFRMAALPTSDHVLIDRAVLTIPYSGEREARVLELRVCPVTESWQGTGEWGTEFDTVLYSGGRLDLSRDHGVATFDVTPALQAIRERGYAADGFVLTVRDPESGIPAGDASRFAGLAGASLHLETTTLPSGPPPSAWLARHGR